MVKEEKRKSACVHILYPPTCHGPIFWSWPHLSGRTTGVEYHFYAWKPFANLSILLLQRKNRMEFRAQQAVEFSLKTEI